MSNNESRAGALTHASAHHEAYFNGFAKLLSIPSVSTDPSYGKEIQRCADWIVNEMTRIGIRNCGKMPTRGHPVVYGEWLEAGEDKPTILVYAHYDVQPVDPLHLWESSPFEPEIREGKLYGRGVIDDKCGVFFNLKAIESILAADGRLPLNVKFIFEGEEEMGSPNMQSFVQDNRALLAADALVMSDGAFNPEAPQITYALRGIVAAEVLVNGPDHDLHSGAFGGVVHNPLHLVGKIVGSIHDADGRVQIPGFYERVRPLPPDELTALHESWKILGPAKEARAGVSHFWAERIAPVSERLTTLPTLDVNGIWGGYQGQGMKTVIPASAGFKATMRIVADQDPREIGQMFRAYVMGFACDTLQLEVKIQVEAWPFRMAYDGPVVEAVQRTLEDALGRRGLLVRGGGSIPIGSMFQQELRIPVTALGLGSGENVHAPNEYMHLEHLDLGIKTAIHLYYNMAKTLKG